MDVPWQLTPELFPEPLVTAAPRRVFPRRLRWALLLVALFHGGMLLFGSYRSTYDAYVHIFLADHYARDWFSTWDQRWYTGFTTVSYPPGTHMAIAAVSKLVGDLGVAFAVVQLAALMNLTVGVYRFSRLWVDERSAANAALLVVVSSSIAETVHVFGQLPTTFALGFLLNAVPFIARWVMRGRWYDLALGTITLAACTAGHHVTTLFGSVFFIGPVLVYGLLLRSRIPLPDEPEAVDPPLRRATAVALVSRRLRRILGPLVRCVMLGPLVIGALVGVVLPYWLWSASDPIVQIPIPHGSRENFLVNLNAGLIFFAVPWGLLLFALPYALVRATLDRRWPLAASIGLLFVLGTGGTTPIPKMLLGGAFDVLTLDRFTFWATIQILPMAGLLVSSLEEGSIAAWLRQTGGRVLLHVTQTVLVIGMVAMALFSASLTQFRPFQPARIDPAPIVDFLSKDQHDRWRFLTLGFGDQMAWLSAHTSATQVDGNYHSVRRLPELTSTSVERLEGAKYRGISGLGSLQQFLEVPEKYNLKFVFSNDEFYDPLLHFTGWQRLGPLKNGIIVWERADIPPLPAVLPKREIPPMQRVWWGLVPPLTIVLAIIGLAFHAIVRPGSRRRVDLERTDRRLIIGPLRWLDRWLARMASRLPPSSGTIRPVWPQRLLHAAQARLAAPTRGWRRAVRLATVMIVVAVPVGAIVALRPGPPTPSAVVTSYFDDLDFRRWGNAYERLDPDTRPDFGLWRLQQSVEGGLLASYAKLDRITTTEVSNDGRRAVVDADLRYLTAINWYPVHVRLEVVHRSSGWVITPQQTDLTVPPDQLARRSDVGYVIQGRRRVTSGTTELTDVQDRPELYIPDARLVDVDGRPVVVGEVVNLDVDPADLTITAVLRGADGTVIGRYDAAQLINHTLRPRESTPFLIDFQQVAAGTDLDFDPLAFTPIQLDGEIASVEIYAKAVVTTGGLSRGVGVNGVRLVRRGDQLDLVGELRNDGLDESIIPRLLVSFLDENGNVLWVQNAFISTSVRSQRTRSFDISLDDISTHAISSLKPKLYFNGIPSTEREASLPMLLDAPDGLDYSSIRIDVTSFMGAS